MTDFHPTRFVASYDAAEVFADRMYRIRCEAFLADKRATARYHAEMRRLLETLHEASGKRSFCFPEDSETPCTSVRKYADVFYVFREGKFGFSF